MNTGLTIAETGLFVIEVDPSNTVEESSEFNNSKRVLLVGVGGPVEGDEAGGEGDSEANDEPTEGETPTSGGTGG